MAEIELGIPGLADYKEIASGGFATVYSAFEPDAGRRVAVKVLRSVDENGRRRFDRERHTMGQTTDHVNIVTMFRSGYTDPGNYPYLVMEHLSGGSLQDRLDNDGPMSIDDAVDVVLSIADGLGFAHDDGHCPQGRETGQHPHLRYRGGKAHGFRDLGGARCDRDCPYGVLVGLHRPRDVRRRQRP